MRKLFFAFGTLAVAATGIAASATTAPAASTVAAAPAASVAHPTYKGAALASQASITMDVAKATALKAHPGKITDAELEKERGGSGLRYSFDITSHGKPYEVGVDAKTGKVLENKAEGAHAD